ncbi:hypothetical protein HNO88_004207 [Novosphingobium chloroacetimidivorans]|uniref:Uncharacterized protein n=1 Tax=Novosphingobium chloroacetimidivorans TaxID=1428314 RepID=A0A7W7KDK2_9SPHN|nr:hypothetical protein [Novosphingobium chloroacetimidivorans]
MDRLNERCLPIDVESRLLFEFNKALSQHNDVSAIYYCEQRSTCLHWSYPDHVPRAYDVDGVTKGWRHNYLISGDASCLLVLVICEDVAACCGTTDWSI